MLAEARDLTKKQVVFGDLTKLITKESTDLGVISVWGTGGEHGMTSIIRKAYQDPEICKKIGCRGWVRLTHPFNPHEFLRSLVDQFYSNCCLQEGKPVDMGKLKGIEAAATPQHVLIQEFMEQVNKKRYLVVLENVTTMGDWDAIRTYLPDSKNGSWIIVSTQQCEIASLCIGHSYQVVELKQYSGAHSVCVFFKEDSRPDKDKCLETNGVMDNLNETSTAGESSHMNGLISYNSVYISKKNAAEEWKNNCCFVERDSEMNQLDTYIANARMNDIHVISVWGIAGVGKSALVRNLYNSLIHTHDLFVNYGWVAVSHPFNLRDFSRSLLSDLIGPHHVMDIRDPIEECCKILETHRCLVVIDDLQSIEEWDLIHSAFVSSPSKSSTIIVITTDASIATHCADKEEAIFNVKGLEAEGSFKLFEKQNIDFSRLRSLTVYGEWKSSFISDRMRLLRVLDLEDASGVNDKDLKLMVQLLPRLKYLSLRGCSEISQLPSSLGDLRQLETLDIRYTSVVTMPWTITKLRKLQYFRFGTSKPQRHTNLPWLPSMFCRGRQVNSVEVPAGIGKITTLHTLGVVNVNTTRGTAVLKEIKKLTQLRKLGVSGISKKNCKNFFSAISNHGHLKSLSVTIKQDNPGLFDATLVDVPEFSPPKNLQSLKLHGLEQNLPIWITQIQMLTKLDLEMTMLSENDIHSLKDLKLSILRLRIKQLLDGELNFCVMLVGHEVRCYNTVKVLEIFCSSNLNITFGSHALQNLELLKARCCSRSPVPLHFSGLDKLTELREVQIECSQVDTMKRELEKVLDTRHDEARIGNAPKRPVLNVHGLVASSHQ
ncbi:hypothetical protein EJB05_52296, partial [Eragrostis curvula]